MPVGFLISARDVQEVDVLVIIPVFPDFEDEAADAEGGLGVL